MDFSHITVLAVGDVMLDRFVEGEIERISPEAPVPVLRLSRTREMPGGVGNVASNIASLGAHAILVGLVGRDDAATSLAHAFAASGRIDAVLIASDARPTIRKTRFIAARQQVVRIDEESLAPLLPAEEDALLDAVAARIGAADAVILSDYGKSTLGARVIRRVMDLAAGRSIPVFVDPKSDDFARYDGAACITPNRRELGRASGMPIDDEAGIVAACTSLMARVRTGAILATRSEKGMTLVARSGDVVSVTARAREVFDVSGAGDTVIAALAVASAAGSSLAQAMRIANAAAGIVVSKLGTATATIAEVVHELEAGEHDSGTISPLQPADRAAGLVAHWKEQGMSVGFTNGCFDILHAGHVSLLAAARSQCDRLVVALNTDESVSRLKGSKRPVNDLAARAAVIAAVRHVDCVVAFAEDTPLALIETLMPDVLVKGADYTIETVVGADIVRAAGGRIVLADLIGGQSTTGIIARAASTLGPTRAGGPVEPHQGDVEADLLDR